MNNRKAPGPTAIARNPESSAEELARLTGRNKKLDRLIASHPNADADTLEYLERNSRYEDEQTKENLLLNFSTPATVLIKLAKKFPCQVIKHPNFELMLKDHSSQINSATLAEIIKQNECPSWVIDWTKNKYSGDKYSGSAILKAIAQNTSVPRELIEEILLINFDLKDEIPGSEGML